MIGILGLVCHAFGHGGEMGEIGSGRVCLDAHSSLFRPCDWAIVFDIEQYPGIREWYVVSRFGYADCLALPVPLLIHRLCGQR